MDDFNIAEEPSRRLLYLDQQDWSLLSTRCETWLKDNPDCLWRLKPFHRDGKECFEFVIKSHSDDSDTTSPEATHSICYICDKSIPKAYVWEHLNSSKHASYQKIAEIGLERARKYKQMKGTETSKSSSEYFCEHCVAVIHLSNRNEHEKSTTHKHFAALDNFLNNFALLYSKNDSDIIDYATNHNPDSNADITLLKIQKDTKEVGDEHNTNCDVVSLVMNDNKMNALENYTSAVEDKVEDSNDSVNAAISVVDNEEANDNITIKSDNAVVYNSLERYIQRLKLYGSVKLYTIDSNTQDRVRLVTLNGAELIISTSKFHGFKKSGKYFQCKLCNCVTRNQDGHREFEKHIRIVAQPFEDKHCIRRLQGPLSHCVICNEVTDNVLVHIQVSKHIKKVERAIVVQGNDNYKPPANATSSTRRNYAELPRVGGRKKNLYSNAQDDDYNNCLRKSVIMDDQFYCLPCDLNTHVNDVATHLAGAKHDSNSKSLKHYFMNRSAKNLLTCKVCLISVPNHTWAVDNHIAISEHAEKFNECLAANEVIGSKYGYFCKPCEKKLIRLTELTHIEKQSHKIKLAAFKMSYVESYVLNNLDAKTVDNPKSTTATKDIVELNSVDKRINYYTKYETKDYKETVRNQNIKYKSNKVIDDNTKSGNDAAMELIKEKGKDEDKPSEEIMNNKCDTQEQNAISEQKTMDTVLNGVNNLLEELLKCINKPSDIHAHLEVTNDEDVLHCIVCNVKIPSRDTDKHTNSLKHLRIHRELMNYNKLELNKDRYICYVCSVYIETGKELRHIGSVDHEKRMDALKNGDYVLITGYDKKVIDKIYHDLNIVYQSDELKSTALSVFVPNSKIDVTNVRYHFCELIDDKKRLVCVLCQKLVENKEIEYRIHSSFNDHGLRYAALLKYNQVFQIQDNFACGYCECIVENEFEHIANEKHSTIQNSDPNKNFCFTCKVSTEESGLKEHYTSESHVKIVGLPSHFYCNICNLQIVSDGNIQGHQDGFEHKNNINILDDNKVILKNKKCVCEVCEATFTRDGLEEHINSMAHIMLLHTDHYQEMTDYCVDVEE